MTSPALRLAWKIVVGAFALWGAFLTLFIFAYWANLLPTRLHRSIRTGVSMSRAAWNRQPRPPSSRQAAERTPQQLPPVDPDSEAETGDDDAESSPAAKRGHRRPPRDKPEPESSP